MILFLLACSLQRPEAVREVRAHGGLSLQVEAGSRSSLDGPVLKVDVADGRRWFDHTWHPLGSPELLAETWAVKSCEPVMWDEVVQGDGFWARGGLCTLSDRWHWALVLARPVGDSVLLTTYVADHHFVPYEEAWVDFVGTALTLGPGAPQTTLPPAEVRERVRAGMAKGLGRLPVPGGGLLSTRVHEQLVDLYGRLPAPPPP